MGRAHTHQRNTAGVGTVHLDMIPRHGKSVFVPSRLKMGCVMVGQLGVPQYCMGRHAGWGCFRLGKAHTYNNVDIGMGST